MQENPCPQTKNYLGLRVSLAAAEECCFHLCQYPAQCSMSNGYSINAKKDTRKATLLTSRQPSVPRTSAPLLIYAMLDVACLPRLCDFLFLPAIPHFLRRPAPAQVC